MDRQSLERAAQIYKRAEPEVELPPNRLDDETIPTPNEEQSLPEVPPFPTAEECCEQAAQPGHTAQQDSSSLQSQLQLILDKLNQSSFLNS